MSNKRLRGVSVYRPIIYGNSTVLLEPHEKGASDHTHRWTVAVRSPVSSDPPNPSQAHQIGGGDDITSYIKKVTFKLHETYPQSLRVIEKPPFEVTETGWGEFDIVIKIFFVPEALEKPVTFSHHLKLHPWPLPNPLPPALQPQTDPNAPAPAPDPTLPPLVLSPVHSWQYEEIIFVEPMEAFYAALVTNPPKPLPEKNRFPRVFTHALGGGGNFGEFSKEMEAEEGNRLDKAKGKILNEMQTLKAKLGEYEKEISGLKKEVEEIQKSQAAGAAA